MLSDPASDLINQTILMSDPDHIGISGINPYEHLQHGPSKSGATKQFANIQSTLRSADIEIIHRASPPDCPDGVYTANWAVTWNGKALLSRLPNTRRGEEAYAEQVLTGLGFDCRRPTDYFSGQGDVLMLNEREAIVGHSYRTIITPELLEHFRWLGIDPIILRTKPRRKFGYLWPDSNAVSGLPDSYFYDIDLAVAVIAPNVLAVCLPALTWASRKTLLALERRVKNPVTIIRVSESEAVNKFACNLVSTGHTVVMAAGAPRLKSELERCGYEVLTTQNDQFKRTGGGIRCICLTLNRA